ncbi:leucine-rich repeat-containing protein 71 isoform 2-T2 [Ciconia maguari]
MQGVWVSGRASGCRGSLSPPGAPPQLQAMRRRGERAPREKAVVEEEMKSAGRKAEQAAEQYQCTGLLEQDFPELCARAGIAGVPKVTLRPAPSFPADEEPAEPTLTEVLARIERKYSYFQPCIQVEREREDPPSVRAVFLRGWKVEEDVLGVLSQCLPALAGLQAVHLWKVGLTERLLPALAALPARCPCLRTLSLEGNPLPEPAFHTLMGSESALAHLSLRNNSIGDADARFIGQSLSSSNRSLVSLVLSFNRISDLGAGYIAQGLRLNRSLLSLSLANNDIGDAGAVRLAEVLGPFALMHAEVVERRRLLLAEALGQSRTTPKETEGQSERPYSLHSSTAPDKLPPAKHGKTPAKKKEPLRKEEARQPKKPPEPRAARGGRDGKPSGQEKPSLETTTSPSGASARSWQRWKGSSGRRSQRCRGSRGCCASPWRRTASLPPARPLCGSRSCCCRRTPSPKPRARKSGRDRAPSRPPRSRTRTRGRRRARFLPFLGQKKKKKKNQNLYRGKEENKPDHTASNSNWSVLALLYIIYISDTPALASPRHLGGGEGMGGSGGGTCPGLPGHPLRSPIVTGGSRGGEPGARGVPAAPRSPAAGRAGWGGRRWLFTGGVHVRTYL